jgi:hypothetical protein
MSRITDSYRSRWINTLQEQIGALISRADYILGSAIGNAYQDAKILVKISLGVSGLYTDLELLEAQKKAVEKEKERLDVEIRSLQSKIANTVFSKQEDSWRNSFYHVADVIDPMARNLADKMIADNPKTNCITQLENLKEYVSKEVGLSENEKQVRAVVEYVEKRCAEIEITLKENK